MTAADRPIPDSADRGGAPAAEADPAGMLPAVESSPRQWAEALTAARAGPHPPLRAPRAVVVAGMGGSGIAADVAAAAAAGGAVPVVGLKGYGPLPAAGREVLAVLVSFSGGTEETLACYEAAGAAGCPRLVVAGGGALLAAAERDGVPAVRTGGGGQPRANLPRLAAPVLVALERCGVLGGVSAQLKGVPAELQPLVARWGEEGSAVRRLADDLADVVPVFYGARGATAVVALRGKCQLNENAKRTAFVSELPEADHNEIVGWRDPAARRFAVVEVRSPADEHPRIASRFEATRDALTGRVAALHRVDLPGSTPLARLAAGILFVDLLSVHLALRAGVDPTPVDEIDELKARLRG